ncbi:MAG: TetR/AcrR family transcriptional regulator [bacterium]|jgi:AcrR family transcriptional regulator
MSRPVSIQPDAILEAARKVFMTHGYKASTALIAKAADVSEGSLFKHYKSKCNLFLAAMNVDGNVPSWSDCLLTSAGKGDIRATLETAGTQLLKHLRLILPRIMMITSSGVTIPKHHSPDELPPPIQKMEVLCRYFNLEIKAGRMEMESPEIQAQAFLGALSHYAWCETLFGYTPAAPDDYIRNVVDILVKATHTKKSGRKL